MADHLQCTLPLCDSWGKLQLPCDPKPGEQLTKQMNKRSCHYQCESLPEACMTQATQIQSTERLCSRKMLMNAAFFPVLRIQTSEILKRKREHDLAVSV